MFYKILGAFVGPLFFSSFLHANDPAPGSQHSLIVERGRKLYVANCLRCHNKDPNIKGSIGPEVVDAPYEVMYSKVMTGKYPDPLPKGFIPKRKSRAMQPLPKLKNDIPALWAYVQSVKKKK
jgi:mono/diheme cytochrome c family protein